MAFPQLGGPFGLRNHGREMQAEVGLLHVYSGVSCNPLGLVHVWGCRGKVSWSISMLVLLGCRPIVGSWVLLHLKLRFPIPKTSYVVTRCQDCPSQSLTVGRALTSNPKEHPGSAIFINRRC